MEIRITFAQDGTVTTQVVGGCGKSCKDLTAPIREALGETTEDRTLPEYHAEERVGTPVRRGGSR
jgi:hypothetical protein